MRGEGHRPDGRYSITTTIASGIAVRAVKRSPEAGGAFENAAGSMGTSALLVLRLNRWQKWLIQ